MHESVKLLEQRCLASPEFVRNLSLKPLEPVVELLHHANIILVTGIGASEGPARLLASCLAGPHRQARFIPLSGLLAGDHRAWIAHDRTSRLVVFSQALSPNAQMALGAGKDFATTVLVCGLDARLENTGRAMGSDRLRVIRHPPESETGFLLRVTGPVVASAIALALATPTNTHQTSDDLRMRMQQCADVMENWLDTDLPEVDFLHKPPAFLVYGTDGAERNHLLRWMLLECFDKHDPSLWDILSFAHGAFQSIFESSRTLILPRSAADAAMEPLVQRLRDMLSQTGHTFLDMPSELPRPWCVLEHIAMVQALVLGHLRKYPRDLGNWPGRGCDEPLYTLDKLPAGT